MQSTQEDALQYFMNKSFGGQMLYTPKKYRKGKAQREPADLAWVNGSFVALLYMCRSSADLDTQIEHNVRQMDGYIRMWDTGLPSYGLRGVNTFGDHCFVPRSTATHLVTLAVVSAKCGIVRLPCVSTNGRLAVRFAVPEDFLVWVADVGGTMSDLLRIALDYLTGSRDLGRSPDGYAALETYTRSYAESTLNRVDPKREYIVDAKVGLYAAVYRHISLLRMPESMKGAPMPQEHRHMQARYFGDMLLIESVTLAKLAAEALRASGPPDFLTTVKRTMHDLHYKSTLLCGHALRDDMSVTMNQAIDEAAAAKNINVLLYGKFVPHHAFVPTAPFMVTMPVQWPRPHALDLTERLARLPP